MADEKLSVLKDIQRWVKIIGIQEARDVMRDALSASSKKEERELRIVYHLTNGENSTRDISSHVSMGRNTISSRQQQWAKMGLVEKQHPNSPYEHLISLNEAGIDVPDVPEPEEGNDE